MFLSINTVREWVDEITYKKAMKYYDGGYVEELKINSDNSIWRQNDNITKITSNVISFNGFNSYEVYIELDKTTKKTGASCTCDHIKDYGPCSHITAVLLKYIHEYQKDIHKNTQINEIDTLINEIKNISKDNDEYKRELNLEINFINDKLSLKPNIELKLGLEKNYVVKNMKKFLQTLLLNESLEFGKSFTYDPSIHKFNDIDEKIIHMFLEIRELEEDRENPYGYYPSYSNSLFTGKKLLLTDKLIYRFFKLAKDRTINAEINGKAYSDIKTIEGDLPLKFNLGMTRQSIELSQENNLPYPMDGDNKVFFYEGSFYIPSENQLKVYAPLYKLINNKRNNKLIISKDDGEKVASYLLPMLKKVSKEVKVDKNMEEAFHETPLLVSTYLDKKGDFITASLKYKYDDIEIDPFLQNTLNKDKGILIRDIEKEENCHQVLKSFGFERDSNFYVMRNEKNIVSFLNEGISKLQDLGEVYYSESFKNIKLYGRSNLKAGIRLNNENLLEFTFKLEGVDKEELSNIFNALREKKKYYKLKKGGFVTLEDDGIKNLVEVIDYLGVKDKDLLKDSILISKYNALYLDQKIKDQDMDYVHRSKDFRALTQGVREAKEMDYELPEHLHSIMRNYQKVGFNWFKTLSYYGFGGILADEMGLGKTLQTIAFLASEKGEKPSLVVAPTSLLYNWQSEIEKFVPELKVLVMSGSKKQREELMEEVKNSDIVITSYPLIRRDIDEYESINFKYCILDEAQQIKNASSQNASSVKRIKAEGYFALTGTPMENSLTELWSIFDFIMPGYLLSHSKFSKVYETPIIKNQDKQALEELNRHIKPFILRRMKKDVLKELPPKIEHNLVVDMTDEQKKLYAAYLASAKNEIDEEIKGKGFNKSKIKIFSVLTRLRQICCDPSVFVEDFKGESGKMLALNDLVEESLEQGHKILLFSQFTSVLKNITKVLDKNSIKYLYLDGNTKSEDRMDLCKEFNNGDAKLFLISLKAGGTGLNLTGADTVIHFDPWWNPAVEEQATDRAHRIGQEKTVEVIKLLAKGTIEEKIFNLQEEKKKIINNVINEDMNEDNVMTKMTQEDLESLFI